MREETRNIMGLGCAFFVSGIFVGTYATNDVLRGLAGALTLRGLFDMWLACCEAGWAPERLTRWTYGADRTLHRAAFLANPAIYIHKGYDPRVPHSDFFAEREVVLALREEKQEEVELKFNARFKSAIQTLEESGQADLANQLKEEARKFICPYTQSVMEYPVYLENDPARFEVDGEQKQRFHFERSMLLRGVGLAERSNRTYMHPFTRQAFDGGSVREQIKDGHALRKQIEVFIDKCDDLKSKCLQAKGMMPPRAEK